MSCFERLDSKRSSVRHAFNVASGLDFRGF